MPEEFNPVVVLAYNRARARASSARAEKALAKLGAPARQTAMRRDVLTPAQRSAAFKAKRGPLGWIWTDSSPEDVIADSRFLKKIVAIHRERSYLRHSGRSTIHLPSGKPVRFHPRTGEVTRS